MTRKKLKTRMSETEGSLIFLGGASDTSIMSIESEQKLLSKNNHRPTRLSQKVMGLNLKMWPGFLILFKICTIFTLSSLDLYFSVTNCTDYLIISITSDGGSNRCYSVQHGCPLPWCSLNFHLFHAWRFFWEGLIPVCNLSRKIQPAAVAAGKGQAGHGGRQVAVAVGGWRQAIASCGVQRRAAAASGQQKSASSCGSSGSGRSGLGGRRVQGGGRGRGGVWWASARARKAAAVAAGLEKNRVRGWLRQQGGSRGKGGGVAGSSWARGSGWLSGGCCCGLGADSGWASGGGHRQGGRRETREKRGRWPASAAEKCERQQRQVAKMESSKQEGRVLAEDNHPCKVPRGFTRS
ncbi:hypothetical protein VP01_1387g2 [Puccinia sorghi]|uniref:Uncharacterized protein n=1 Tax=Puccinia sorghi TaxID=27349 RepID=A0A0L6VN47_9BASI|nr:hypothetical protein VP01_1387g2 [Puccinia sorghi]